MSRPVVVVGAGPVGLITALGLVRYRVPVVVLEEDDRLSLDTKAGTILTRTLEVLHRYRALPEVLRASLRIDEIGDVDRETNVARASVHTGSLADDTRFPFVVNIPQHELEPVLHATLEDRAPGAVRMGHRVDHLRQVGDHVDVHVSTATGPEVIEADYVLACDGGRSTVRTQLGIEVDGSTLAERYMLVDLEVDLDVAHPRDYPYLAYFGDPSEWMILIRQPHCWRFLFPLTASRSEPATDELVDKARRFIGDVGGVRVLGSNVYAVHHRVATRWRDGRVFLMGDAAHLITPMWALGLNTGVLDASNLPWRLAWVLRGWAEPALLEGYETEQAPVAARGSAEMAEAARAYMDRRAGLVQDASTGVWGTAFTRTLLGVRLDVDGTGDWSMVRSGDVPAPVRAGDRAPDLPLFGPGGAEYLHDLAAETVLALHFCDARRRPALGRDQPGLRQLVVSRWDAPHDSGLRERSLFDPGDRLRRRIGLEGDAVVVVRPDAHVASISPMGDDVTSGEEIYERLACKGQPV